MLVNKPMPVPLLVPVGGGGSAVHDGGGISVNSVRLLLLFRVVTGCYAGGAWPYPH